MWLYSAVLGVGLVLSAPWWLLRMATTARYREGLRQRLGAVPAGLRAVVAGKCVVWVHAVSVGEVLAVSRLVGELEAALNSLQTQVPEAAPGVPGSGVDEELVEPTPTGFAGEDGAPGFGEDGVSGSVVGEWVVMVSTTTRTGQALARERFGAERVFYLPLDFAWAVRAYLHVLRPAMVVLAESELWPRMLHECGRAGVPVAVVNARVSDRSFRRAMRVRWVWGRVLGKVTLFLAQSAEDARRLEALGARDVRVSGNVKYDVRAPGENVIAARIRELAAGRPVIVAGSTCGGLRDGEASEEEQVLAAWGGRAREACGALLVLAPRHPERFEAVRRACTPYAMVRASGLVEGRGVRARGAGDSAGQIHGADLERLPRDVDPLRVLRGRVASEPVTEVVLLDTLGDLSAVYGVAAVAFVGGSLVRKGGHNPLEPARFGVPVVMGPSFENFRAVVGAMQQAEGLRAVADSAELSAALAEMLEQPEVARAIGERGRQVFEREGGATARSIEALMGLLRERRVLQPEPAVRA